jgi:hypothetical protein
MSLYAQRTAYECGPFALKHALLTLGVFAEEHLIGHTAGTTSGGTDERQLAVAARRLGFDLPVVRCYTPTDAQRSLCGALASGTPVLLCIDQWEHWVALTGRQSTRFVMLDSAEAQVIRVVEWPELEHRWVYRERSDARAIYDLCPLVARGSTPARGAFTPERALAVVRHGLELGREWGEYAADLIGLSTPAEDPESPDAIVPLTRVLAHHRTALLDHADGTGPARRAAAAHQLDGMCLVADAYGLGVARRSERDAVRHVADMLKARVG